MRQPTDHRFAAEVGHRDGVAVVAVLGEVDQSTAPEFRRVLEAAVGDGARVEVDLRETTFMDSTGLAVLIETSRRLRQEQEEVVVRNPQPPVRRLLEVSGVDAVVDIRDGA